MNTDRRRVLKSLAGLTALASAPSAVLAQPAVHLEGFSFEPQLLLAGSELHLNGTGVRQVAWFKGYVAAMYLAGPAHSAAKVVAMKGPKRLQLGMLQNVPAAEFTKALRKGLMRNVTSAELEGLGARVEHFANLVDGVGKVRRGDIVDLDYEPARGLVFSLNGTLRGDPIPGDDLYAGLLRAFVGDRPYDDKMKAGLLGHAG